MHAITVDDGQLSYSELPTPEPGPGEIRIAVKAAGVNRADLVQRAGRYPPPPGASPILGLEVSGTVDALGEGVTTCAVGDEVCALLAGGGYATHVVCDARHAVPLPPGLDAVQAAAVVEVYATAWLNLMHVAGLAERGSGAKVLLHAGASGVGTAAIQLMKMKSHHTYVTAGSADKIARCVELGADGGANRHDGSWVQAVQAWALDGVDVVLDPVGANYLQMNVQVLAKDGHLVSIGLLSGRAATLDMGKLLAKRLHLHGSTLRARSAEFKATLLAELVDQVWPHFADGTLKPIVHGTFPLAEADAAHTLLSSDQTVGALVLTV